MFFYRRVTGSGAARAVRPDARRAARAVGRRAADPGVAARHLAAPGGLTDRRPGADILRSVCGIAGTVGGATPDAAVLGAMAAAMAHRGPDGEGVWHDATRGLAFRRLAIIDLDERSDQPLHLGPWHLVFNGEIYNYRELREELRRARARVRHRGRRRGAAARLGRSGARARWTASTGCSRSRSGTTSAARCTLAADPFGEKPLYWALEGGAARLRLGHPRAACGRARPRAAARRASLAPLPRARRDAARSTRASSPGPPAAGRRTSCASRAGRVERRALLGAAPGRRARPRTPTAVARPARRARASRSALRLRSDVPVGTSLSGGVDSSAIVVPVGASSPATTAATRSRPASRATSATSGPTRTTSRAGRGRASSITRSTPTAAELLDDLDALVRDQEEPFGGLSIYAQWRVMRAAREAGVTVLLDGQGADELFGGYDGIGGWAARSRGPAGDRPRGRPRRRAATSSPGRSAPSCCRAACAAATGAACAPRTSRRDVADAAAAAPDAARARRGRPRSPLRRELLRQSLPHEPAGAAALRRPRLDGPQPRGAAAVPRPPHRRASRCRCRRSSCIAAACARRSCAMRPRHGARRRSSTGATRSASSRRRRRGCSDAARRARGSPRCCSTRARARRRSTTARRWRPTSRAGALARPAGACGGCFNLELWLAALRSRRALRRADRRRAGSSSSRYFFPPSTAVGGGALGGDGAPPARASATRSRC